VVSAVFAPRAVEAWQCSDPMGMWAERKTYDCNSAAVHRSTFDGRWEAVRGDYLFFQLHL
jgi:hypothetical protein